MKNSKNYRAYMARRRRFYRTTGCYPHNWYDYCVCSLDIRYIVPYGLHQKTRLQSIRLVQNHFRCIGTALLHTGQVNKKGLFKSPFFDYFDFICFSILCTIGVRSAATGNTIQLFPQLLVIKLYARYPAVTISQ